MPPFADLKPFLFPVMLGVIMLFLGVVVLGVPTLRLRPSSKDRLVSEFDTLRGRQMRARVVAYQCSLFSTLVVIGAGVFILSMQLWMGRG